MGVNIKDILEFKQIELKSLANKTIAIDTFNMLYQFLASIRQANGEQLQDSYGNITSHLKGLFNRLTYFKKNNIKAIFVFDGEPLALKEKTRQIRRGKKEEAEKKMIEAKQNEDYEEATKRLKEINKLDSNMIKDAKTLIELFGFPIIDAINEGESQSAYLVNQKMAFASSSQDFDSLLFGANYLIRNLSVSQKRKIAGTSMYKDSIIEFYDLEENLKKLNISLDELIIIAVLCGTDFNVGGIKGIGPKKALKLVKENKEDFNKIFEIVDWYNFFSYSWVDVFNVFKKYKKNENPIIEFSNIQKDKILEFLKIYEFDENQTKRSLDSIKEVRGLNEFF